MSRLTAWAAALLLSTAAVAQDLDKRGVIKKNTIGCADRGLYELIVRTVEDQKTPITPEFAASIFGSGKCNTLKAGTEVLIKTFRDRAGVVPPTVCVVVPNLGGSCYWITASRAEPLPVR